MAKNKVQDGNTIEFVAASDLSSGDLVEVGHLVVVVHEDVKTGETAIGYPNGVWELPKASAATFAQGATVYVKNGEISNDNTGLFAGKAWVEGANGEITAHVCLNLGHAS
jgi:predicted RecA/RadA family phage recombinase